MAEAANNGVFWVSVLNLGYNFRFSKTSVSHSLKVFALIKQGLRLTHPGALGDKEYNAAYRCDRVDGPVNNEYDYIDEAAMLPLQRCSASTGSRTDHSDPSQQHENPTPPMSSFSSEQLL